MRKLIAGFAITVILLAVWRIGASVYQYELWQRDHLVPAILPPAPPKPPAVPVKPPTKGSGKLPKTLPPHEPPAPPADAYDPRRALIYI